MTTTATMHTPAFFDAAPTITAVDPLAEALGAAEGGVIEYRYVDAVKLAGHSCPTVAGAWLMTRAALAQLYRDQLPRRGDDGRDPLHAARHRSVDRARAPHASGAAAAGPDRENAAGIRAVGRRRCAPGVRADLAGLGADYRRRARGRPGVDRHRRLALPHRSEEHTSE